MVVAADRGERRLVGCDDDEQSELELQSRFKQQQPRASRLQHNDVHQLRPPAVIGPKLAAAPTTGL